ncbi:MAG TPA: type II toxin-antitoxin system VapC family toxin [Nocardioidaceae bacterium]|nr:type II toxin-antitoxin system VapC family toxin [Nocardioidaceae bacterium]
MKVVDTNVLLYAINRDAVHHEAARRWLTGALNAHEPLGFTWVVLLAFVRLSTSTAVLPRPLDVDTATTTVAEWLGRPNAVLLEPGASHLSQLRELLTATGAAGNLVSDAHIGAVALHYRATVVSYDNDFSRFPGVRWEMPS